MIKKKLKNLSKLGILIAVRQAYFLGRNIYNLYYSPYLTLKKIKNDGDKSQFVLVTAAALTPVIIYVILRIIYDLLKYGRMVPAAGKVFLLMGIIQTIVLIYLGYWTLEVLRKEK